MGLTITREGRVAVLTMDDGKVNALRPELLSELDAALDASMDAGAVVLAGRLGTFSAGLDTRWMPTLDRAAQEAAFLLFGRVVMRVYDYPRPTVAAVTGHAIAGGALLALACDLRVGADGASRFGLTEVPLGLPMPAFGVEIVRNAVPRWLQAKMLLHGRVCTQAEARDACLFDDLYSPERVVENAIRRAGPLSKLPSDAYATTKERLHGGRGQASLALLQEEVTGFIETFRQRVGGR